jgi:hypothetical protein
MLFSTPAHVALLAFGLLAIPVTGRLLRAKQAWATALLWLIPVALTVSLADLALIAVDAVRPGTAFRSTPGGVVRLGLASVVLLPPVEIFYQRLVTRIAGGGPHMAPPGDFGEDATPTDPADPDGDANG